MARYFEETVAKLRNEIYSTLVAAHKQKKFSQVTMNGEGVFVIYPTKDHKDSITLKVVDTEEVVGDTLRPSKRARITFAYSNSEHVLKMFLRIVWEGSLFEGSWKFNGALLLRKLDRAMERIRIWKKQDEDRRKTVELFSSKVKSDFGELGKVTTSYLKQTWEQIAVIAFNWGQLTLTSLNCGETYRVTNLQTKGELKGSKIKSIIERVEVIE